MFIFAAPISLITAEDVSCISSGIPVSVGSMRRASFSNIAFSKACSIVTLSFEITIPMLKKKNRNIAFYLASYILKIAMEHKNRFYLDL